MCRKCSPWWKCWWRRKCRQRCFRTWHISTVSLLSICSARAVQDIPCPRCPRASYASATFPPLCCHVWPHHTLTTHSSSGLLCFVFCCHSVYDFMDQSLKIWIIRKLVFITICFVIPYFFPGLLCFFRFFSHSRLSNFWAHIKIACCIT